MGGTVEAGPIRSLENGGPAVKGNVGMNEIKPAIWSTAIQKLISERAYELWENHGRPQGCDLIHWREAEQEIMDCLSRTQVDSPPAAGALPRLWRPK